MKNNLGLAHLFNLSFITCITPSNSWAYVARRHAHTTLADEFWVQTFTLHSLALASQENGMHVIALWWKETWCEMSWPHWIGILALGIGKWTCQDASWDPNHDCIEVPKGGTSESLNSISEKTPSHILSEVSCCLSPMSNWMMLVVITKRPNKDRFQT